MLLFQHSPAAVLRAAGKSILRSMRPESMLRAQAVAFLMFLAFFPALLFLVGAVALVIPGWQELLEDFRRVMPPGSRRAVVDSLRLASMNPLQLVLTGALGMAMLGTQLMSSLTRVFGMIYGRTVPRGFWRGQARALGMVLVTVVPWVVVAMLLVFGRAVRGWVMAELGGGFQAPLQALWAAGYHALVFLTAMLVLATLYHFLTPGREEPWLDVMPGAALAILLWWVVSTGFGFYVRYVALYDAFYGGFAAAIGLLIWMFLSALVILIGAQFNTGLEDLAPDDGG